MKISYFIMHFALLFCNTLFAQEYTPYQLIGDIKDFNAGLALEVNSTSIASKPCPSQSDAQRLVNDALTPPQQGWCYFSTDRNSPMFFDGIGWVKGSGGLNDWLPNHDYKVGDIVILNNNEIIKCITAHTSAATFFPDFSNWTFISLQDVGTGIFTWNSPYVSTGTNPNTIKISAGTGVVVTGNVGTKQQFSWVQWPDTDNIAPVNMVAENQSFVFIQTNGNFLVTNSYSNGDIQNKLKLANIVHRGANVTSFSPATTVALNTNLQFNAFQFDLDVFKTKASNNCLYSSTATLQLNRSACEFSAPGANPANYLQPNRYSLAGQAPVTFQYYKRDGFVSTGTNLDPTKWDDAGTLRNTNSNRFGVHRLFTLVGGNTGALYPQREYDTLSAAEADVNDPNVIIPKELQSAVFYGAQIVLRGNTTATNDILNNTLYNCGKFGCGQQGGGAGGSGYAGDVLGPASSTDNAIPRFDGATGKNVQNSGILISDTNDLSGIKNFIAQGTNTNTPSAATPTTAIDFMVGRTNAGGLVAGQTTADIGLEYGGGGFKHFISTQHNGVANSGLNAINFYLNNSTTSIGSTTPATGNILGASVTAIGTGIFLPLAESPYAALDVVGDMVTSIHGNTSKNNAAEIGTRSIGMQSGNAATGFTGMKLNVKATQSDGATADANNSDIEFYTFKNATNSREVARITENGRLGIGTTNPTKTLSVIGNSFISNLADPGTLVGSTSGALQLYGTNSSQSGPHTQWTTNADIYPLRQFHNWNHNAIADCFDCYWGTDNQWHNSNASSAFRWYKGASNLTLGAAANPTAGGTEAFTTVFDVSENGDITLGTANSITTINGSVFSGQDIDRVIREEINSFNIPALQNCNAFVNCNSDPLVVPAGINGMYLSNANWQSPIFLPAVNATVGAAFYYQSDATFNTTITNTRTNIGANITLSAGNTAVFVSNGTAWLYQGQYTNANFNATRRWPVFSPGTANVGINTTSPLDYVSILNGNNAVGGVTVANNGAGASAASALSLITFFPNTASIVNATNRSWQIIGRGNAHASNPNDLQFVNNNGNTATIAMTIKPSGQVQVGSLPTTTANGAGSLLLTGPNSSLLGPNQTFVTNQDNFPTRQFLNWTHDSVWDCFDCYYDGAAFRNSSTSSSFRWGKSSTDLILASSPNPTAGGTEAITNRFGINESGNVSVYNDGMFQIYNDTNAADTMQGIRMLDSAGRSLVSLTAFQSGGIVGGNPEGQFRVSTNNGGWGWQQAWTTTTATPPGVNFSGAITAQSYANNSDEKLKRNISDIPDSEIEKFMNLRAVKFQWNEVPYINRKKGDKLSDKETDNNRFHYGMIAQNVSKYFPDMVEESVKELPKFQKDGKVKLEKIPVKSYQLNEVQALLVKVVQSQQKEIDNLKKRIEEIALRPSQLPLKRPKPAPPKPKPAIKKDKAVCCPNNCVVKSKEDRELEAELKSNLLKEKLEKEKREKESLKQQLWWIRH